MTIRNVIRLFVLLLVISLYTLVSPLATAQEGTRVTMGPWQAFDNAGEITLYLKMPPDYSIHETRKTQEGGPLLYIRGPATEHQEVWRSKGRGIFVGVYSTPNPEQMSLQQLLERKTQEINQEFEDYVVEPGEGGITRISGYEACYGFYIIKDMKAVDIYGYPLSTCDLDIYIRLDEYHPGLPGGDFYLHIKCDFWEMQYPEEDIPVLKNDLDGIFHSMQIEVGVAPMGGGIPIVWIIVPVVIIIVVMLVLLYFRYRKGG
jgi:hypothetical protein